MTNVKKLYSFLLYLLIKQIICSKWTNSDASDFIVSSKNNFKYTGTYISLWIIVYAFYGSISQDIYYLGQIGNSGLIGRMTIK